MKTVSYAILLSLLFSCQIQAGKGDNGITTLTKEQIPSVALKFLKNTFLETQNYHNNEETNIKLFTTLNLVKEVCGEESYNTVLKTIINDILVDASLEQFHNFISNETIKNILTSDQHILQAPGVIPHMSLLDVTHSYYGHENDQNLLNNASFVALKIDPRQSRTPKARMWSINNLSPEDNANLQVIRLPN